MYKSKSRRDVLHIDGYPERSPEEEQEEIEVDEYIEMLADLRRKEENGSD